MDAQTDEVDSTAMRIVHDSDHGSGLPRITTKVKPPRYLALQLVLLICGRLMPGHQSR